MGRYTVSKRMTCLTQCTVDLARRGTAGHVHVYCHVVVDVVLHLGDSMVYGTGVAESDRFTSLLNHRSPDAQHVNAGFPGTGADHHLTALRAWLPILKPDAVARGLNFQITERFEKRGFTLVACRMRQATKAQAEAHYGKLKGTPAFDEKVTFLTSGPCVGADCGGARRYRPNWWFCEDGLFRCRLPASLQLGRHNVSFKHPSDKGASMLTSAALSPRGALTPTLTLNLTLTLTLAPTLALALTLNPTHTRTRTRTLTLGRC